MTVNTDSMVSIKNSLKFNNKKYKHDYIFEDTNTYSCLLLSCDVIIENSIEAKASSNGSTVQ